MLFHHKLHSKSGGHASVESRKKDDDGYFTAELSSSLLRVAPALAWILKWSTFFELGFNILFR